MTISAADFHITNSTVQDIENLNLALFYLQGSSVATDILKNMVRLGVTISITDHINDSFDLGVNIIYWNPKSSLVILDSTGRAVGVDSAAIALIHQGAQATDPHFIENASHPNSQYGNDAEQYAFGKANQVVMK